MTDQNLQLDFYSSSTKSIENEKPARWSDEERQKFQAGLKKFGLQDRLGPGGAELMATYMGDRSVRQIKSHWQRLPDRAKKTGDSKGKRPKPCAACRRAKSKCEGVGRCSRCQKKGIPCVADLEDLSGGSLAPDTPERPIAFQTFNGLQPVMPSVEMASPWPRSLKR
eukprot:3578111-Rhodomonas_salina.1